MKPLSERIPHHKDCDIAAYKSGNYICYVVEVSQLEADLAEARWENERLQRRAQQRTITFNNG